jgi:hypothetical protein
MKRIHRAAKLRATNTLFGIPSSDEEDIYIPETVDDAVDDVVDDNDDVHEIHIEEPNDDSFDEDALVNLSTDSENEQSDGDNEQHYVGDTASLMSPSGIVWSRIDNVARGRETNRNVYNFNYGFKRGLHPKSRKEAFEIMFEESITTARLFSNKFGRRASQTNLNATNWKPISAMEMNAFIGLHMLAGAYKAHHRHTEELWSESDGHPIFRASMSFERFKTIKSVLRFDDTLRRDKDDPLAPIRSIMDQFNSSVQANYIPGPHLTLDEQLVEFHGRVKFRRYIPTKPGKYGLLLYWITDAETSIPVNGLVYIGDKTLSSEEKQQGPFAESLSIKLAHPFLNKSRNITMDNFFTSLSLAKKLSACKTTIVGTMRINRRELPPACKSTKERQKGDTIHFKYDKTILCSFWDKKNKPVVLLSSMHPGEPYKLEGKCEAIEYYNNNKWGVDNFDELVRTYSSQRKCRRWPYAVYFTLADAACVVAYKLWTSNESHYSFKKELAKELCWPLIIKRSTLPNLRASVKNAMTLLGITFNYEQVENIQNSNKRGRCHICTRSQDTKTKFRCNSCQKFVCSEHRLLVKEIKCHFCNV